MKILIKAILKKEKVKDTYVATIDTNTKNKQEATRLKI